MPGLDGEMLRTATGRRFKPLFVAADGTTASGRGTLTYDHAHVSSSGDALMTRLLSLDPALPTWRPVEEVHWSVARQEATRLRMELSPARCAVITTGVKLIEDGRPALAVSLLVRVSAGMRCVIVTTADLTDADTLAQALVLADLHERTLSDPTYSGCISRCDKQHGVHTLKASSYRRRVALRTINMLANLAVVGTARTRQTRHSSS